MLNKHNILLHTVEAHREDVWETVELSAVEKGVSSHLGGWVFAGAMLDGFHSSRNMTIF